MTTISIIDDHNPILNSLSLQFQTQNYSTITFNCPEKALTYHAKNPVEGYVIDMKMPKMSGIDFYEQLCLNQLVHYETLNHLLNHLHICMALLFTPVCKYRF